MSKAGAPRHDPIPIGEIAAPPFARPPDPTGLFAKRSLRLRALTEGRRLARIAKATGAPPQAGQTPSPSGGQGAHGTRFCTCSLCATQWHVVRSKCVPWKSTEGIAYQALDCGPQTVQTETCEKCYGYVKILHQHKDPELELFADDVALGLDILLREDGYRRGGVNPLLLGY